METTTTTETAEPQEEAQPPKETKPQEVTETQETGPAAKETPTGEKASKKKAIKAAVEWSQAKLREPRKRRPIERFGIDVVMNVTEEQAEIEK